ncbi:MAG: peptidoglycan DL-endopeptidase CwlO [Gaiellales bacterium]|jgi:cell wall-associated NlpC family hydrolase|nr:peptidoglycan DL-endopeptidase CwlO [Gaiellales bacterium]MDX6592622.1 peptidoglycan DL-endopeptidase CwlO [Gaiellales bacterium]
MRGSLLLTGVIVLLITPPAYAVPSGITVSRPVVMQPPTVGDRVGKFALRFRGTPYVWAGTTPAGFDCSGFTRYAYARFGIDLPHSSYAQWGLGRHVSRAQLRPGDLVFFGLGHVGLWMGHGTFIHSPHTGTVVSVERLAGTGYASSFSGAVRVAGSQQLVRKRPVIDRGQARRIRATHGFPR